MFYIKKIGASMFNNPSQEKKKILGIRLNEASLEEFSKFCQDRHVSKSELARTAITQYIVLNYNANTNPKLIFSKSQFKYLCQCLSPDQINQLAHISVENGLRDTKTLDSFVSKPEFSTIAITEIDFQIKTLQRFIFSPEGQSWFETFNYEWDQDALVIHGTHLLGENFSQYIQQLLCRYFAFQKYELVFAETSSKFTEGKTSHSIFFKFHPISKNNTKMNKDE